MRATQSSLTFEAGDATRTATRPFPSLSLSLAGGRAQFMRGDSPPSGFQAVIFARMSSRSVGPRFEKGVEMQRFGRESGGSEAGFSGRDF